MEELKIVLFALCIIFCLLIAMVVTAQIINISFFDCIPSEVHVDGELVYQGSSAGFDIESAGDNTNVTIRGGFLYLFPQKCYTSKNVKIVGSK